MPPLDFQTFLRPCKVRCKFTGYSLGHTRCILSFCYIVGALYCIPEHSVVCIHTKIHWIHHKFIRHFICVNMFSFVFDHKPVFRRSKESSKISLNMLFSYWELYLVQNCLCLSCKSHHNNNCWQKNEVCNAICLSSIIIVMRFARKTQTNLILHFLGKKLPLK